jgi:hypothetical protein
MHSITFLIALLMFGFSGRAPTQILTTGEFGVRTIVVDPDGPKNPWTKLACDLDGDGLDDLIVGGQKGPLVWYHSPDWRRHRIAEGGWSTVGGAKGDVDGDGDPDIILGGTAWFENPGTVKSSPDQTWRRHAIGDDPTHDALVADFDGDGRLDVVTRNQSEFGARAGNKIRIWLQKEAGRWEKSELACDHGEGIAVSDLDQDRDPDIVIGGTWFETLRDGLSTSWAPHAFAQWHPNATIAIGNFSSDHRPDVVLSPAELAGQTYRISWFEAPTDPRRDSWREHVVAEEVECVFHSLGAADIDLNGSDDIVFAEMHQGTDPDEVGMFLNSGKGEGWVKFVVGSTGSHGLQLLDFDGDGDIDIFGANWSGPNQSILLWDNHVRAARR